MRKRKVNAIRAINRSRDGAINAYGRAVAPRRPRRGKSFFDIFMDEATGAPHRR